MPDYGHELRFGIFPTPAAATPHRVLELAQLADVGGLDLVTVQDHPYQAAHLDALALLGVIGARTTSVSVAPNVASLPLRPPVVLATTLASLDLLTDGRVELGLGAGAFWDGIVAAGGPRRTPREAVDALVEAIGVVRACWSGETVRLDGEHYPTRGLRPGPVPSREIPLWLGAYGPRMLRVTADLADAWIPSMGYADPPALAAMNARIDERAEANGRGPQAVRRMYNVVGRFGRSADFLQGSTADWAEQLAGLALDEGVSTFVLGTDAPDDVRRFAAEVAPAVREQVADERALRAGGPPAATRTAAPPPAPAAPEEWDESTRPTYPRPEGATYSSAGLAQAQHLVDIHDHLRGELDQLRDVVEQVRRGLLQVGQARSVINTMTMRQNNWTLGAYCESYCRVLTGHHTLEDRSMLPHLAANDPAAAPVVERLEQEHEVIAVLLEELDRRLVALVGAAPGAASAALEDLAGSVDLLADRLLSHLRYEEVQLHHPLATVGMHPG